MGKQEILINETYEIEIERQRKKKIFEALQEIQIERKRA